MNELSKRSSAFLVILGSAALVDMILVYAITDSLIMVAFVVGMVSPFLFAAYLYASLSWKYDQAQLAWQKSKRFELTDNARTLLHASQMFARGRANVFSFMGHTPLVLGVPAEFNAPSVGYRVNGKAKFIFGLDKEREFKVETGEMYIILSKNDLFGWSSESKTSYIWGFALCWTVLEGDEFVVVKVMS